MIRPAFLPRLAAIAALIAAAAAVLGTDTKPAVAANTALMVTAGGTGSIGHTCAVTVADGVQCWGSNSHGQLGDGTTTERHQPVDVAGLTGGVAAVSAGQQHTCALTAAGGVKCWGRNTWGQLGDGTWIDRHTPVNVQGLTGGVTAITTGEAHACALTAGGAMKCWGSNFGGALGDGTHMNRQAPVAVSGLSTGIVEIAAGNTHTCARTGPGILKCWGGNAVGQVGDGSTTDRSTPLDVAGLPGPVASFGVGDRHTCAAISGASLWCWGDNTRGQLGDGSTTDSATPRAVCADSTCSSPLYDVIQVTGGDVHTCVRTAQGAALCWGANFNGQIGDGTTTERRTPVEVHALTPSVAAVTAGDAHSCALITSGAVRCWGRNANGQLGDGTTADRSSPVDVLGLAGKVGGDVNCDGQINSIDAALVLQFTAGLLITLQCFPAGDMNSDGVVDAVDAAIILQIEAGIIGSSI